MSTCRTAERKTAMGDGHGGKEKQRVESEVLRETEERSERIE